MVIAHRLPRKGLGSGPDPIIARFVYFQEREWFLATAKKRPFDKNNKPVMVYTDLPPDMKKARAAKQMRSEEKQARIRVICTRVMLEHRDNPKRQGKHQDRGPNKCISSSE